MLIETHEGVINTACIALAKPASDHDPARWSVTLMDGSTQIVGARPSAFGQACGTIIPARADFAVLRAYLPSQNDEGIIHGEEVVLAFRVGHGGDHIAPMPITVSGEPMGGRGLIWTVREPNGHCYGPEGDHETPEAWRAHCDLQAKRVDSEAKGPAT